MTTSHSKNSPSYTTSIQTDYEQPPADQEIWRHKHPLLATGVATCEEKGGAGQEGSPLVRLWRPLRASSASLGPGKGSGLRPAHLSREDGEVLGDEVVGLVLAAQVERQT